MEDANQGSRHELVVTDFGDRGVEITYEANLAERQALCQRLDLLGLDHLAASFAVMRERGRETGAVYRVDGRLRARVVQSCVVTLTPVESAIDSKFERRFGAAGSIDETAPCVEVDLATDEDAFIESLIGDAIDLGAIAAEQLALELDPFPRAHDAVFDGYEAGGNSEDRANQVVTPFRALVDLKDRLADRK